MPYITREDGEHFVIPSYRDVLTAKQKNQLKREILALSQSYGEYITMQRKGAAQYEVAFSPDTGYLLGESIWHFFNRPLDMIYCEAIPNTTEAILVIVKAGSVYLDGSFPVESIPEELVIFLTQENNFEIYIHGDVPISEIPEAGKFSFEKASVKSFTVLDRPAFPTLPLLKIYQLQLVDPVLKAHGIGVFPIKAAVAVAVVLGLAWMGWTYITTYRPQLVQFKAPPPSPNPYLQFNQTMASPDPTEEINALLADLTTISTMPGWQAVTVTFADGGFNANVQSQGGTTQELYQWGAQNKFDVSIGPYGFMAGTAAFLSKRPVPKQIFPIQRVLAALIDRVNAVYPGNNVTPGQVIRAANFKTQKIAIRITNLSPAIIGLVAKQFRDLPLIFLDSMLNVENNGTSFSGTINVEIVGN